METISLIASLTREKILTPYGLVETDIQKAFNGGLDTAIAIIRELFKGDECIQTGEFVSIGGNDVYKHDECSFAIARDLQENLFDWDVEHRLLFSIKNNGEIIRGEAFTTEDEMSLKFWEVIETCRPVLKASETAPKDRNRCLIADGSGCYVAKWGERPQLKNQEASDV